MADGWELGLDSRDEWKQQPTGDEVRATEEIVAGSAAVSDH